MHRRTAERYTQKAQITADKVVEHALRAVQRGKLYATVGRRARWLWRLKRLAGTTLLRFAGQSYRRRLRKFEAGD